MTQSSGQIYEWLRVAVAERGAQRSIYTPETTLTRRGLLTRADRRATDFRGMGIEAGDVVAVSLGNSAEYLVMLLALSKLGAISMPVDPANGDRVLCEALARIPTRAVVRRPRGQESAQIEYPPQYNLRSSRRLPGSMTSIDLLETASRHELPGDTQLLVAAIAGDTVTRDVVRTGSQLVAIGKAAAELMGLDADCRLLCIEPLTSPRFFDPVLLGWLASPAQLAMSDGGGLEAGLALTRTASRVVVVNAIRGFLELARAAARNGDQVPIVPVIPEATVPIDASLPCKRSFGREPIQLLQLEECGLIAGRAMIKGERFTVPKHVQIEAGHPLGDGQEILMHGPQCGQVVPEPPPGQPNTPVEGRPEWRHTGYVGRFSGRRLRSVLGRQDGLVNIEGRRASIAVIRDRMLEHRRITAAQPSIEYTRDGDPVLTLRYHATGHTDVDDIEEHAIGHLAPYMVPRVFTRVD
ncbi:MAG: AMP-binding protein [Nannocystaceae bacterium]